jgi:hypothetical protein
MISRAAIAKASLPRSRYAAQFLAGMEVRMTTGEARNAPLALTIGLAVLGLLLAVVGVVYITHTADTLPAVFPGHQAGSIHHHIKHAIAAFGLAVGCGLGAWLTSGRRAVPVDATAR